MFLVSLGFELSRVMLSEFFSYHLQSIISYGKLESQIVLVIITWFVAVRGRSLSKGFDWEAGKLSMQAKVGSALVLLALVLPGSFPASLLLPGIFHMISTAANASVCVLLCCLCRKTLHMD